jgi:hypothetical protein
MSPAAVAAALGPSVVVHRPAMAAKVCSLPSLALQLTTQVAVVAQSVLPLQAQAVWAEVEQVLRQLAEDLTLLLEPQTQAVVAVAVQVQGSRQKTALLVDLASSSFVTRLRLRLRFQLQDHPPTPSRAATASINGPAAAPSRSEHHGALCTT